MSKILWIVLICVGAVIVLFTAPFIIIYLKASIAPLGEKQNMAQYLDTKYGSKFTVGNVNIAQLGLGGTRTFKTDASPTDAPSLKFEISREENWKKGVYLDNYLRALWSQQAKTALDKFTVQLGGIDRYEVETGPKVELRNKISGYTPSFAEAQTKFPSEFGYQLTLFGSKANQDRLGLTEAELSKALAAANFIKSQKSDYKFLKYSFRYENSPQELNSYTYRVEVKGDEFNAIQSVDDLKAYIKKLGE